MAAIEKVSEALSQEKLENDINITETAKKEILNDKDLFDTFITSSRKNPHLQKVDEKKKCFVNYLKRWWMPDSVKK